MKKFIVFSFISIFCIVQSVYAQIDSVGFIINNKKIPVQIVSCYGNYFFNSDTVMFEVADTSDYIFSWIFDKGKVNEVVVNDTLPHIQHQFSNLGEHSIQFNVEVISTANIYSKERKNLFQEVLEVPNVFTPNGDGINDLFIIKASGLVEYRISIFSRLGILVFQEKAPIITWDGRNSSGNEVSQGTYFYIIKAIDNSIKPRRGTLLLYR